MSVHELDENGVVRIHGTTLTPSPPHYTPIPPTRQPDLITDKLTLAYQALDAIAIVQHSGSSVDPDRQSAPHVHAAVSSPAPPDSKGCDDMSTIVYVMDLGLDKVFWYKVSATRQRYSIDIGASH